MGLLEDGARGAERRNGDGRHQEVQGWAVTPLRGQQARGQDYSIGAALLVGTGNVVLGVVAPQATGWTTSAISGTTMAYLAVTLLTTPLQAVGEELMYRSVLLLPGADLAQDAPVLRLGVDPPRTSARAGHLRQAAAEVTALRVVAHRNQPQGVSPIPGTAPACGLLARGPWRGPASSPTACR